MKDIEQEITTFSGTTFSRHEDVVAHVRGMLERTYNLGLESGAEVAESHIEDTGHWTDEARNDYVKAIAAAIRKEKV